MHIERQLVRFAPDVEFSIVAHSQSLTAIALYDRIVPSPTKAEDASPGTPPRLNRQLASLLLATRNAQFAPSYNQL
jgi:hypothetical protein